MTCLRLEQIKGCHLLQDTGQNLNGSLVDEVIAGEIASFKVWQIAKKHLPSFAV